MRCYNGCPDSALQAVLDQQAADDRALKLAHPEAHCTYFPVEQEWQVHIWGVPYGAPSTVRSVAIASGIAALRAKRPAGGGVSPG